MKHRITCGSCEIPYPFESKKKSAFLGLNQALFFSSSDFHRYHGGWLAPNIYFLGFAGCVQVNGVRIAGLSGIYNKRHYKQGEGPEFLDTCPDQWG